MASGCPAVGGVNSAPLPDRWGFLGDKPRQETRGGPGLASRGAGAEHLFQTVLWRGSGACRGRCHQNPQWGGICRRYATHFNPAAAVAIGGDGGAGLEHRQGAAFVVGSSPKGRPFGCAQGRRGMRTQRLPRRYPVCGSGVYNFTVCLNCFLRPLTCDEQRRKQH
jgi:hypothetical protein